MDIVELEDDFFKNTQDYSALTGNEKPEIIGGQVGGTVMSGESISQVNADTQPLTYNNWYQIWLQKYPITDNRNQLSQNLKMARREYSKLATSRKFLQNKKTNMVALNALADHIKDLNRAFKSFTKPSIKIKPMQKFRNAEGDFDVVNDYFEMEEYSNLSGLGKFRRFRNPNIIRPQEIKVTPPPQQMQEEVYTPVPPIISKGTPITPFGGMQPIIVGKSKYRVVKPYAVPMDVADLAPKVGDFIEGTPTYRFGQYVILHNVTPNRVISIPLDVLELVKIPTPNQLPKELPTGKPQLFYEYMNNWVQQYPFIKGNTDPRTGEEIDENFVRKMISDAVETYRTLRSFSKSAMLNKAALKQHIINLKNFYNKRFPNLNSKPFRNADGDTNNNSSELLNGLMF